VSDSRQPPATYDLRCSECGRTYDSQRLQNFCTDCNRPLVARFHLNVILGEQIRERLDSERRGLWRYREVLPVGDEAHITTLGEGGVPLTAAPRLAARLGLQRLWIKDESQNPTGSFKARGMSVAISKAVELGARRFCLPSAGNAAGAAAAYGALAGCAVRVYMPSDSGEAFFAECRACGAEVFAVDGTIADCGKRMREECTGADWFDLSTLKEPFRLEGKKTMGYELWEDFGAGTELPDVIVYPTGGGTGLIGMWKAFDEMEQLGWIGSQRPRMISVQSEGCAPIVRAFESGAKTATPVANPKTAALGLRVPGAFADVMILRAIRESHGLAISVTEDEWADGSSWLASDVGLFASPEGGAAVAAVKKAAELGTISATDRVVVFNTGSGYKYPPATWPRSARGQS
jgi:threonine synthase